MLIVFVGILFGKELSAWEKEKEENSRIEQEKRKTELENRINTLNRSEEPPTFTTVYFYKRVGNHKDVLHHADQFRKDFEDNFENYENEREEMDIFDINSDYKFKWTISAQSTI